MTTATEVLGVLVRADKRYAGQHDLVLTEPEHLQHLAAAVDAHIRGKQRYRNAALRSLLTAVLLDAYDPDLDLVEQAEEAERVIRTIHTFLLGLHTQVRGVAA